MRNYLLVFAGGGIGASARYWLSGAVYRFLSSDFPYGNLVVNITGCFAIGLLMTLMEERFLSEPALRIFLTIGILGGFTTFSSFSYESIQLLQNGGQTIAMANILANMVIGFTATWLGMMLVRFI